MNAVDQPENVGFISDAERARLQQAPTVQELVGVVGALQQEGTGTNAGQIETDSGVLFRAYGAGVLFLGSVATLAGEPHAPAANFVDARWDPHFEFTGVFGEMSAGDYGLYRQLRCSRGELPGAAIGASLLALLGRSGITTLTEYAGRLEADPWLANQTHPFADHETARRFVSGVANLIGADRMDSLVGAFEGAAIRSAKGQSLSGRVRALRRFFRIGRVMTRLEQPRGPLSHSPLIW